MPRYAARVDVCCFCPDHVDQSASVRHRPNEVLCLPDEITCGAGLINVVKHCDVIFQLRTLRLAYAKRKGGNVLFNDALNTFYLWLYVVGHMVKTTQTAREETR